MTAPVAYGFRTGIAQCHVTGADRMYFCAQHFHAFYVCVLTLHIGSPHKHLALHVHQCTHRRCGHAVLSGSRLCDDAGLTHFLCQQDLSDGIVDLMGTRMVQVFALQIHLTTVLLTHAFGIIER